MTNQAKYCNSSKKASFLNTFFDRSYKSIKRTNHWVKKRQRIQKALNLWKGVSSIDHKKNVIKSKMRCCFSPVRLAKIRKFDDTCWPRCWETDILIHSWWMRGLVPLQRILATLYQTINIHILCPTNSISKNRFHKTHACDATVNKDIDYSIICNSKIGNNLRIC